MCSNNMATIEKIRHFVKRKQKHFAATSVRKKKGKGLAIVDLCWNGATEPIACRDIYHTHIIPMHNK